MRLAIIILLTCMPGLIANAQTIAPPAIRAPGPAVTVPMPRMSPSIVAPPAPSAIAPRPANELAPTPVAPPIVPSSDVDRMMQTICPEGESCAKTPPAH